MMKKVFMVCAALVFAFASCSNDSDSPSGYGPTPTPTPTPTPAASYTITIEPSVNGTIGADKSSAKNEETVTLKITPDSGFELIALDVGEGYVLTTSGNKITFKMPNSNVTVKGVFCAVVTKGEWPQTIKAAAVTVDENVTETRGAFTYYKGSDDAWYAKQAENAHESGEKYSDGTAAGQGGTSFKYFKVEPIKWRVVTTNYGGKKLLMANQVLAVCAYYDTAEEDRENVHPNNYKESRVRAFLNGLSYNKSGTTDSSFLNKGFLQTAFNSSELATILTTTVDNSAESTACSGVAPASGSVCDNTDDKLFLLSLKEATTSTYKFPEKYNASSNANARVLQSSDYAKACGLYCRTTNGRSSWQLRSPAEFSSKCSGVRICMPDGNINAGSLGSRGANAVGVAPALCVNN